MGEPPQIIRVPDAASLAERLADDIARRLALGVAERGRASLVVPGGSTPGPLFDALGGRDLPWNRVDVTLNDERWVSPGEDGSNERLVRQRLLAGPAAAARFVGLKTGHARAADGLAEVSDRLAGMARPFDVMLLGMGADGHTASLFPGSQALEASLHGDAAEVQAVTACGARGSAKRITLALPALLDSRFIALLVTGEEKLETLARAKAGSDPLDCPIRAVLQGSDTPVHVYWSP
jgi:6-phosphogluconolactonase